MTARHRRRAVDDPPRLDPHPDRLGAHHPNPTNPRQQPAASLLARLHAPKETP